MAGTVFDYLQEWGVEELRTTFEENEIDIIALSLLDEKTIKELIPKIGQRMKFMKGWRKEVNSRNTDNMLSYTCFKCLQSVEGNIKKLFFHLKHFHGINAGSRVSIVCSQEGCKLTFATCYGYKKHLLSKHPTQKDVQLALNSEQDECVDNSSETFVNQNDETNSNIDPEELEPITSDEIRESAAVFLARLKSSNISSSLVQKIICDVQEFVHNIVASIENKVTTFLDTYTCTPHDEDIRGVLCDIFSNLNNPFSQIDTETAQKAYFLEKGALILPEEKLLGYHFKFKLDRRTGSPMQVQEKETFQYVPLAKSLKQYLELPGVMECILSAHSSSEPNILMSYRDGIYYKSQDNDMDDRPTIPLLLYYDDFETVNPLGSKRGKHKLGAFYIGILPLPAKYQARLSNILLYSLAKSSLITKYGIDSVITNLKDDLQRLSKEGGLHIESKDYTGMVIPKLFQVVGDNLGVHSLLGYVTSFTANYYCRYCKGHRSNLQKLVEEDQSLLRNKENYSADIISNDTSLTGVKTTSVLNQIDGYHVVENVAPDVMHDFTEGIIPLEMHLVLQRLIEREMFTLEEINSRIISFNYGFVDKTNKPSPIKLSSLLNPSAASGQTSAQMTCLALNLALMLGDRINQNSEEWEVFLLLIEIFKIVMSQSISLSATYVLKALIKDHHELFLGVFPYRTLTPKQHFLLHYPTIIRKLGPLRQYSSLRFEGKHKSFKHTASICNNFQNIAKTLANKHQMNQCYSYLIKEPIGSKDVVLHQEVVTTVQNLAWSEPVIAKLGCKMEDEVIIVGVAEIHGYDFREGVVVLMTWGEEGPSFGQIQCVSVKETNIYLILTEMKTICYERHLQAFAVKHESKPATAIMEPKNLFDYRPLTAIQTYGADQQIVYIFEIGPWSRLDQSSSASDSGTLEIDPFVLDLSSAEDGKIDMELNSSSDASFQPPPLKREELSSSSDSSFQPPPLKREKRVHFDVRNILIQTAAGRRAMQNTDKLKYCSKPDRKIIVDLCTDYLMQQYGDKPSSFTKAALAEAITTSFPCLIDPGAPLGYEAWYCKGAKGRPATGYIEEHLRYVRKKAISLCPGPSQKNESGLLRCKQEKDTCKQVASPGQKAESEQESEIGMMTEWLKSNIEPVEKVKDFMLRTAQYRQKRIKDSNGNINSILMEFPRMLDQGMIEQDFEALFPEKSSKLYQKWEKLSESIITYSQQTSWKEALGLKEVEVANLTADERKNLAFFLLPVILRGGGRKGRKGQCSLQETIKSFIDVQPEVLEIEQYLLSIDAKIKPQPFVVCRGHRLNPTQAYVIVERRAMPQASLLKAIDVCFKSVYIWDVEFQPSCKVAWQFLQNVIYEFLDPNIPSCVRNMRAFIAST
ncbi:hypothetical protein HOLleu_02837 [Holothuria leucospilota]|uniref:C2H2-type domain-containing protein n=1 Tax=Holothuria leucospilota TaxID=206669 RepID=A0A9Q1CR83_HOLLE|nr:hypothetical protein HOLleu_02837 [Holothuria leucospilota]